MLTEIRSHPNAKDAEQVELLTAMGASVEYIANHLRIEPDELSEHYPEQLKFGTEEANLRVAKVFFDFAVSGKHPVITLEWMRMKAKWGTPTPTTAISPEEMEEELRTAREKLTTLLNRESSAR